MSQRYLGLFDTPPDRQVVRVALAIVGLLFAATLLILPVRNHRLAEFDAFVPMMDAITFVSNLIIAALLFVQAGIFRSRALTALGSGFVLSALLLVVHALTFPGAFTQSGLLGAGLSTTAWIASV